MIFIWVKDELQVALAILAALARCSNAPIFALMHILFCKTATTPTTRTIRSLVLVSFVYGERRICAVLRAGLTGKQI